MAIGLPAGRPGRPSWSATWVVECFINISAAHAMIEHAVRRHAALARRLNGISQRIIALRSLLSLTFNDTLYRTCDRSLHGVP